jgi:hypothetical protein
MEIIAGLNMHPVARLSKTWAVRLSLYTPVLMSHLHKVVDAARREQFKALEALMDSKINFKAYRQALATERVRVPYMGLFARDCLFLHDANPDYLEHGHLNWQKAVLLGKLVHSYRGMQHMCAADLAPPENFAVQVRHSPAPFLSLRLARRVLRKTDSLLSRLQKFFNSLTTLNEDELYQRSLVCEPREDQVIPSTLLLAFWILVVVLAASCWAV